jgi:hypothetical protein
MSVAGGHLYGPKVEIVGKEKLPRERLLLLRDALIVLSNQNLTQEDLGIVFNRHPDHIGRIIRQAPAELKETALGLLQG